MNKKDLKARIVNFIPRKENIKINNKEINELDFYELEEIMNDIFTQNLQKEFVEDFFQIYEKYPLEDNDYFWSMLHGIESINLKIYGKALLNSIKRQPSFFVLLMINRMINNKISDINGENLMDIFNNIKNDEKIDVKLRNIAKDFFDHQNKKDNK